MSNLPPTLPPSIELGLLNLNNITTLQPLISAFWNENHVFVKSDKLFKWQYTGYGLYQQVGQPVLYKNEELVGFRLIIPAEIRYFTSDGDIKIAPLGIGAMYMVIPELRGMKLGLALQQFATATYKNYFVIASNLKTSSPIYRKSGYHILDEMYRYVMPLKEEYKDIMFYGDDKYMSCIFDEKDTPPVFPIVPNSEMLGDLWKDSLSDKKIITVNKTAYFWQWRYIDSPIYKYVFFGGKEDGGIIVGRILNMFDEDVRKMPHTIFRILEIIPVNSAVWDGDYDIKLVQLIKSVCKWAQEQNCIGVEFYCSSSLFAKKLDAVGMKEVNYCKDNIYLDIASYFEPLSKTSKRLSNVTLYIEDCDTVNFEKSYFTLSDCDQDRPNIIS